MQGEIIRTPLPRIADIKRAVAREFNLTVEMLEEPAPRHARRVNTHNIAHPRQVAMAFADLLTEHSRVRIGYFFGGRHPATVRHAVQEIARRRPGDAKLRAAMRRINRELIMKEKHHA